MAMPRTYIDWYCPDCGLKHTTNKRSFSYPCNCPKCGKNRITFGFPLLPVNKAWCDKTPQQYNLLSNQKDIQVYLQAATGERVGYVMDPDWVPDCNIAAYIVAEEVIKICETKFLFSTQLDQLKKVLAAMNKCKMLSYENERINRLNELRRSIILDRIEYNELKEEEARWKRQKVRI